MDRLGQGPKKGVRNLEKVLSFVKDLAIYSHVLVDAGHHLDEISIKALELADQVILVADQSVPALSNTRKLLEIFELLGLGDLDLEIWLNSWDKHGDLSLEDVAKFLGRVVKGTVPFFASEVKTSINEGIPLAKSSPNLNICQELGNLADHFSAGPEKHKKHQSRWNNWLGFLKRSK